jgi:hypothetical protein
MKNYLNFIFVIAFFFPLSSYADVFVSGYYKSDGTYVKGYWRSDPKGVNVPLNSIKEAEDRLRKDNELLQKNTEASLLRSKLDSISNQLRQLNQSGSTSGDICLSTLNYHLSPLPCFDEVSCKNRDEYYARARSDYDQCKADEYNRVQSKINERKELQRQSDELEISLRNILRSFENVATTSEKALTDEEKYGRYIDLIPKKESQVQSQPKPKVKIPTSTPVIKEAELPILITPTTSTSTLTIEANVQALTPKEKGLRGFIEWIKGIFK